MRERTLISSISLRHFRDHLLQNQEGYAGSGENHNQRGDQNCRAAARRFMALGPLCGNLKVKQLEELLWRRLSGFGWLGVFNHVRHQRISLL